MSSPSPTGAPPEPGSTSGSEAELVRRTGSGDERAFALLYEAHRGRVFRLAYGILLDRDEAREATQEAFLRLHRVARSWQPRAAVGTWLHRVVLNHCLSLRRRLARAARTALGGHAAPVPSPESRVAMGEAAALVARSLAALPVRQRAVACLFLEAELAPAEIAPLVGLTANATRVALHRALGRLRADLRDAGFDAASSPDEAQLLEEARDGDAS